jgi:hypothetical protein
MHDAASDLPRTLERVEKVAAGPICGLTPGSKRPKTAFSAPKWASEVDVKEFFNSLSPTRHFGE